MSPAWHTANPVQFHPLNDQDEEPGYIDHHVNCPFSNLYNLY